MTTDIVLHLSHKPKHRSKYEQRTVQVLTCEEFDIDISGDGALMEPALKVLQRNNCDFNRLVAVYRGDTLVFKKAPLKAWLFPVKEQPEQLKRENWNKK